MARTALTLAQLPANTSTGLRIDSGANTGDASNGNVYPADVPYLLARNTHGSSSRTITFTATIKGASLTKALTLLAGEVRLWKLDRDVWGQHGASDIGKVYVDVSTTDVQLVAFRRP